MTKSFGFVGVSDEFFLPGLLDCESSLVALLCSPVNVFSQFLDAQLPGSHCRFGPLVPSAEYINHSNWSYCEINWELGNSCKKWAHKSQCPMSTGNSLSKILYRI